MADVVGEDRATAMIAGTDRLGNVVASYLVQEEDGVSRFILEEDGGFILLEESAAFGAGVVGEDHAVAGVVG